MLSRMFRSSAVSLALGYTLLGIAALVVGLVELYKHFKTVRDVVADAGHVHSGRNVEVKPHDLPALQRGGRRGLGEAAGREA